jgi:transcriptional regulator with XRE-family HTH domain
MAAEQHGEARVTTREASGRFQPRPNLRRERRKRGWAENDVAVRLYNLGVEHRVPEDELGVDARTVSRWELGKSRPNQTYTALLSLLFNLPPEQLGLRPLVIPTGFAPPSTVTILSDAAATAAGPAVDSEEVKRREFTLMVLLGMAGLPRIDLDRLAATLAGSTVDSAALDDLETLTGHLMREERDFAPDALLPAVRGHFNGFGDILLWTPSNLSLRAQSLAAETALLAGYLSWKAERRSDADLYWSSAHRLAHLGGNPSLRALVLLLISWRREDDNDHAQAFALVDEAASVLGPSVEPAVATLVRTWRASLYAKHARDHAERALSIMRDLDAADRSLSRLEAPDTGIYVFESIRGELMHSRAQCLLQLGDPAAARVDLEQLLGSTTAISLSWRSDLMADLGSTHAASDDPDEACTTFSTALQLATRVAAPHCTQRLIAKRQRWLVGYDTLAVRTLDDQLRAVQRGGIGPRA